MSLETGGRSDKVGNQYENRCLAKLLLRLIEESIISIEVEPLGREGEGVEYIVETSDHKRIYYQCKASNGAHNKWSAADLHSLKIFKNAKMHIMADIRNEYHFISPISYDGLDDLCNRARTNHDPQDFINYQLTNNQLRNRFDDCAKYFGLNKNDSSELRELLYILAHCYFELIPDNYETIKDLESIVSIFFVGRANVVRSLLENCVNENQWYGIRLTAEQVVTYMEDRGCVTRVYGADERILPRVRVLNKTYWGEYLPIKGELFHREATDEIFQYIKKGISVVLHGRAGSGKSGCVEEVIKLLSDEKIPYLSIKLDKYIPKISADEYGKDLGLPESPVYCLKKIAAGNTCVLILDQLDSLRWTAKHSAVALDVCKEMIVQADAANRWEEGKISILFVTRTFDYKNDTGIRNLFLVKDIIKQEWKDIELGLLSAQETRKIVGSAYSKLSPRVQHLLRTPSNLYVWSQLLKEEQLKSIISVNQLMKSWWEQILKNCEERGLLRNDVEILMNTIITRMNNSAVFALPKRLFLSKDNIIDALISNGLLVENPERISFTHQSFLDYFLATEAIQKILDGEHLVDIIGRKNDQTPNLRYRLLSILQGVSEIEDSLFLMECEKVLVSDRVRYYYKCAVFEAIAQCDNPSEVVMEFAKKYLLQEEWYEYVRQIVYYGNILFIKHLAQQPPFEWNTDEGLWLLKSINHIDADFVATILWPYCFQNHDDNQRVYNTLCYDVSEDTESMYALRLRLLSEEPALLSSSWSGFYYSFKNSPSRAIDYLNLLLQNCENEKINNIYFPDSKILKQFSKDNTWAVIYSVLPSLCYTSGYVDIDIEQFIYRDNYENFSNKQYNYTYLRKIVQIVKWAMQEIGENEPQKAIQLINNKDYSQTLVGNELILSAIEKMPVQYADSVIEWIIKDFPHHFFDYTGDPSNFLESGKRILKRFSSDCSDELFYALEKTIVSWKESVDRMVRVYNYRTSINREKTWGPVYYSFWGHIQKELLPMLDVTKLSSYAKGVLATVDRNTWIEVGHFHARSFVGPAKSLISPVAGYADRLSDKTWLQIVGTPIERMSHHYYKEKQNVFIEAIPSTFSSDLEVVAKKNPARFSLLALQFPRECYYGYISAIFRALKETEVEAYAVKTELICDLIRKFWKIDNIQVRCDITDLVKKRAAEEWPDDILKIVAEIALMPQKCTIIEGDSAKMSAHDLHMESINSPRGCALEAIAAVLWEHEEVGGVFREVVERTANDLEDSVRFATVACAAAYYNIDMMFSTTLFRQLLSNDLRILFAHNAWDILIRDYRNNQQFYEDKLFQAAKSEINDLSECAAGFICALAIFCSDKSLLDFILEETHTDDMVMRISNQAASTFGSAEYHEISKQILLNMAERYDIEITAFSIEFFKEKIIIERDKEFLQLVLKSKSGTKIAYSFLKYLSETDEDIVCFVDVIKETRMLIPKATGDYRNRIIVDDLIQCVIRLFDRGKSDSKIRITCLDIWDELFRNNLHDIKPLADMLDNFD